MADKTELLDDAMIGPLTKRSSISKDLAERLLAQAKEPGRVGREVVQRNPHRILAEPLRQFSHTIAHLLQPCVIPRVGDVQAHRQVQFALRGHGWLRRRIGLRLNRVGEPSTSERHQRGHRSDRERLLRYAVAAALSLVGCDSFWACGASRLHRSCAARDSSRLFASFPKPRVVDLYEGHTLITGKTARSETDALS